MIKALCVFLIVLLCFCLTALVITFKSIKEDKKRRKEQRKEDAE